MPIYEAGEIDGHLYIAMRYVEGTDLASLLRREGPLAPDRAVGLVAQLADALDAAHARGLVHRDVKPSNALIAVEGAARARLPRRLRADQAHRDRRSVTASDQLVGTIDYLAPERIRGEQADGRADLYSLGCVLFECLTGEVPFPRDSEVAAIYAHLEDEPPRASERRPGAAARRSTPWSSGRWRRIPDAAGSPAPSSPRAARAALAADAAAGATPRRRRASRRRGARWSALALPCAVAGDRRRAGPGALGGTSDPARRSTPTPSRSSTLADGVAAATRSPSAPRRRTIAAGAGAVWVTNADGGHGLADRSDDPHGAPDDHSRQRAGRDRRRRAGGVWVVNSLTGPCRGSPQHQPLVKTITVGNGPTGVCVGGGAVWVADRRRPHDLRIDPTSRRRTRRSR